MSHIRNPSAAQSIARRLTPTDRVSHGAARVVWEGRIMDLVSGRRFWRRLTLEVAWMHTACAAERKLLTTDSSCSREKANGPVLAACADCHGPMRAAML